MAEDRHLVSPLENRKMPRVAAALRAKKQRILKRWDEMVRESLPSADKMTTEEVRDSIPAVLEQIARSLALATDEQAEILCDVTRNHGITRFHEHFSMHDVMVEYRFLRTIIAEELWAALWKRSSRTRADEMLTVHAAVDISLQQAVVTYTEHQQRHIRQATEAESRYLSFLSHDLRSNLNSILLTVEAIALHLERKPELKEEYEELKGARGAIWETMEGMERLMQSERLHRKAVEAKPVLLRLHDVGNRVISLLVPRAKAKGLRVVNEIPTDVVVKTDEQLLMLILQNLVGNAIKYTEAGVVRILCVKGKVEKQCGIGVEDTGRGISEEERVRIFDMFRRGEAHGQEGAGLGLAIVSAAAALLDATIAVDSTVGKGSRFTVWLPEGAERVD
ncbi:MAG: sensor histidine kinase [Phycisphaerae bacterium]